MGLINLYRINKLYNQIREGIENRAKLADKNYWFELFKTALSVKEIQEMLAKLQGYKTYIVAALSAVLTTLKYIGKIDEATYNTLMALLASGGLATVAAKINRVNTNQ